MLFVSYYNFWVSRVRVCEGRNKALKVTKCITLSFGCRSLVLASPNTASGETTTCATRVIAERAGNVGFVG